MSVSDLMSAFVSDSRKCVLLLNTQAPGIDTVRWRELASQLRVLNRTEPRNGQHPAEMREIPGALFLALITRLAVEFGAPTALGCVHEMEGKQIVVCSPEYFHKTVENYVGNLQMLDEQLSNQLSENRELASYLTILNAS